MTIERVFIVSDHLGLLAAGAGRAAMLLADELAALGLDAAAYGVQPQPAPGGRLTLRAPAHSAWLQHGYRWRWPHRCLMAQVRLAASLRRPRFIIAVGITRLTRSLLRGPLAARAAVWETTNADPGNRFVDAEAAANLRRALAVLSPSDAIDARIRKTYSYDGPIVRLPFWTAELPEAAKPHDENGTGYDFAYLGRMDPEKGIGELIEAFALASRNRPARMAICGFGDAGAFRAKARECGLDGSVDFFPDASEETVERILRAARWAVLPSHHEGYPLSILEAAQRGVPIIATSVGSIPGMIGDSAAGVLVGPRDVRSLAGALGRVSAESPERHEERRAAAREMFRRLSGTAVVRRSVEAAAKELMAMANGDKSAS